MKNFTEIEHPTSSYNFEDIFRSRYHIHADLYPKILATTYFHENDFPLHMHSHSFYEVNVITEGEGIHYIGKNSFPVKTGDVFVIPPDFKHGYEETRKLTVFHIALSDAFMQKYQALLKEIYGYSFLFELEPNLRVENDFAIFPTIPQNDFVFHLHEMNILSEMCLTDESGQLHEENKCLKILNLLADFAKLMATGNANSSKNTFLDTSSILKSITFIEKNYSENFTINDLCKISNMSRSSLLKQFAKLCKCSPANYLLRTRIERSCELLRSTDYSIARIAQDCGFYDSSHFTKSFSQVMKLLPKEYRNRYKNQLFSK
ncbi:MAG: helix-turn-helix domain-containing protein [Clostridiales bacterium]|nr:helix-turn-helix domain-containing protein [Clostridiales bacterium]